MSCTASSITASCSAKGLGAEEPVELLPVRSGGKLRFRMVAKGKPVEGSELTVVTPDGKSQKAMTDKEGLTIAFEQTGRFAVWGRYFEAATGQIAGKSYEEIRNYPTLVIDVRD